jgi:DNA-binding transcriptional ArsR family regulator
MGNYLDNYLQKDIHIIISLVNDMSMSIQLQRLSLKSKLFRGLGDSTRLSILELLRDGEKSASEIVKDTDHSQSNVSNHLSCLLDCGLVQNRREGKNIFYSLRDKRVSKILEESDALLSELARGIYECVNYNEEPKKR